METLRAELASLVFFRDRKTRKRRSVVLHENDGPSLRLPATGRYGVVRFALLVVRFVIEGGDHTKHLDGIDGVDGEYLGSIQ